MKLFYSFEGSIFITYKYWGFESFRLKTLMCAKKMCAKENIITLKV